ncbi:mitofusin [Coemansia sp. RSA 1813]|nr:mitofusin [Coemansia sp. RSA 1646]KAJ1773957.1 mitofusin [Coemansia sp. RSA 1843]KAJ2089323.1 mitofusin [Coemansia sp. RSA 986]KAJ2214426.1 mitofusin [Coemansia sp. RSA 487]KAJ2569352.1 mitofusin [Coemansia sp. RSA 1813]
MNATHQEQVQQQRIFADKCRRLHTYLSNTKFLLQEIGEYNRTKWPVHYPLARIARANQAAVSSSAQASTGLRRTNSMLNSDSTLVDSMAPVPLRRAMTADDFSDTEITNDELRAGVDPDSVGRLLDPSDLSVLKLDLRLSYHSDSDVMGSLEESSIARLFDERLMQCEAHIDKLIARVTDKSSKILVTGDLNAGKSTLVNALIRKDILPFDQQPCTMLFCEVVDASLNGGAEEVHAIPDISAYNRSDASTFAKISMSDLEDIVMENSEHYQQLKIYTNDCHSDKQSLLHNGVVDVALIDSPGLNRDSLKTTQLFARQEEIDVVVFVVNAENHFTLSGQDFLLNAGKEKAHIFIVVNRFDAIRRKDRCERMILDQIRELSPLTYEERGELVHFVSAHEHLADQQNGTSEATSFASMEKCLRSFTLEQRFKSKLAPAQRYAMNVLFDVQYLAAENVATATKRIQEINAALREGMPKYETLLQERTETSRRAEAVLDGSCLEVRRHTTAHLTNTTLHLQDVAEKVSYPGLLSLWSYAESVLLTMVRHLEHEVSECDRFACFTIQQARQELSRLEAARRVLEEATSTRRAHDAPKSNSSFASITAVSDDDSALLKPTATPAAGMWNGDLSASVTASQIASIGSISNELDTIQLELSDFVDLDFSHNWGALTSISASASLTLFASKSMVGNVLTLFKMTSTMGPHTARRLVVATAALVGLGSVFYILSDMDGTVRRKLSSRVSLMLEKEGFVECHAERLTTETSRAIRPFVWHLQHTFQRMVEAEEHRRADHLRRRHIAQDSQIYFDELRAKAQELAGAVRAVSIDANMC